MRGPFVPLKIANLASISWIFGFVKPARRQKMEALRAHAHARARTRGAGPPVTARDATRARLRDPWGDDLLYAVGVTAREARYLLWLPIPFRMRRRLLEVVLPQARADMERHD